MKRNRKSLQLLLTVSCTAVVAAIALVSARQAPAQTGVFDSAGNVLRGFQIAPVPLNTQGKDPFLVGLGSYLVNAPGGCNGCHTQPAFAAGGNPFMGQPEQINAERYLAGGRPFGAIISRNLTPDAQGRPAGLTLDQFRTTLRTGADLKNVHPAVSPLLQVMPWPEIGKMTDRDIAAVYEYLRAIPSRPSIPPTPPI